jgi:hypothetical protein
MDLAKTLAGMILYSVLLTFHPPANVLSTYLCIFTKFPVGLQYLFLLYLAIDYADLASAPPSPHSRLYSQSIHPHCTSPLISFSSAILVSHLPSHLSQLHDYLLFVTFAAFPFPFGSTTLSVSNVTSESCKDTTHRTNLPIRWNICRREETV